jgi:hypothetical protein
MRVQNYALFHVIAKTEALKLPLSNKLAAVEKSECEGIHIKSF